MEGYDIYAEKVAAELKNLKIAGAELIVSTHDHGWGSSKEEGLKSKEESLSKISKADKDFADSGNPRIRLLKINKWEKTAKYHKQAVNETPTTGQIIMISFLYTLVLNRNED